MSILNQYSIIIEELTQNKKFYDTKMLKSI